MGKPAGPVVYLDDWMTRPMVRLMALNFDASMEPARMCPALMALAAILSPVICPPTMWLAMMEFAAMSCVPAVAVVTDSESDQSPSCPEESSARNRLDSEERRVREESVGPVRYRGGR